MATTISISEERKEKLRNLGKADETYDDIIRKMYKVTKSKLLLQFLYDESDSVDIDEAIASAQDQ